MLTTLFLKLFLGREFMKDNALFKEEMKAHLRQKN